MSNDAMGDEKPLPDDLARLVTAIARDRDRDAFRELFGWIAPRIKSYLMKTGLSADIAEDLVQETMLNVWRKASLFDPARGTASTWIFTIARNTRIDTGRKTRREPVAGLDLLDRVDPADGPELTVLALQRERRVRDALGTLTKEQATVLRLSFFGEKPHLEISRELGIPIGTVKSRIRLAINKLRVLLDDLP